MPIPECCVCFTPYDEDLKPQMLTKCGHTFCEKCIQRIKVVDQYRFNHILGTATATESINKYKCPICKQTSSTHICNYEVIKIRNEYMELSKKLVPPDPVEKSLNQTLQKTIKEIELKTKRYAELKEKVSELTEEIQMLERNHHPIFDAHYEEVRSHANKDGEKIIEEANRKAEKIIEEANRKAEFEAKAKYTGLEYKSLKMLEREQRRIDEIQKKFKEQMLMENMMRAHKRNFINHYDSIIETLSEFKQLIKTINMTVTDTKSKSHSNPGSPKKQLHKLIETINSWDIKLYTSYFKTG